MLIRVLYNLFIFISIVTMPWYSYALFIIAGFFLFDKYIEGIAWGAWIDVLFGGTLGGSLSLSDVWHQYWFTLWAIVGYLSINRLKLELSWYD